MGEIEVKKDLPSLSEWLEGKLGVKLPSLIPLPQTRKNLDKAISRLVLAGADNIESRIHRDTENRIAISKGEAVIIDKSAHLAVQALDGIEDRAEQFAAADAILKQQNRESIVAGAIENLSKLEKHEADASSEISLDWLNMFSSISQMKSSDEIKSLFSKILAGEVRSPGSFSLRSLAALSSLDQSDASLIHRLFGFVLSSSFIIRDFCPITTEEWIELQLIGVVSGGDSFNLRRGLEFSDGIAGISYGKKLLRIRIGPPGFGFAPIAYLTKFGFELFCFFDNYTFHDSYFDSIVLKLHAAGFDLCQADITSVEGRQRVTFENERPIPREFEL